MSYKILRVTTDYLFDEETQEEVDFQTLFNTPQSELTIAAGDFLALEEIGDTTFCHCDSRAVDAKWVDPDKET